MHHHTRSSILSTVLALLRAQYLHYRTIHWTAKDEEFYSDHLLFERLYDNLKPEIDELAEKIVGLDGESDVELSSQIRYIQKYIDRASGGEDPIRQSIKLEELLQKSLSKAYNMIDSMNQMTLGLDDFLMALASDHETHLYLLRQRAKED